MHTYSLRWCPVQGRPLITEVLPYEWQRDVRLPDPRFGVLFGASRPLAELPQPRVDLDPVAGLLWRRDLPRLHLPLLLRCLAAWWRLAEPPDADPRVLAAALTRLIRTRAGVRATTDGAAAEHGVEPGEVRDAASRLQKQLQLRADRVW